jgi:hypothetical protein
VKYASSGNSFSCRFVIALDEEKREESVKIIASLAVGIVGA